MNTRSKFDRLPVLIYYKRHKRVLYLKQSNASWQKFVPIYVSLTRNLAPSRHNYLFDLAVNERMKTLAEISFSFWETSW